MHAAAPADELRVVTMNSHLCSGTCPTCAFQNQCAIAGAAFLGAALQYAYDWYKLIGSGPAYLLDPAIALLVLTLFALFLFVAALRRKARIAP